MGKPQVMRLWDDDEGGGVTSDVFVQQRDSDDGNTAHSLPVSDALKASSVSPPTPARNTKIESSEELPSFLFSSLVVAADKVDLSYVHPDKQPELLNITLLSFLEMAATPPTRGDQWIDHPDSPNIVQSTKNLDIGISGMSLMASMSHPKARQGTASTVSTSPPEDSVPAPGGRSSAPPSPSNERSVEALSRGQLRPPGMPSAIPSPISKPGHSKSSSASSPLHSLTSNSTADANSDWNSLGRQTSPFQTNEAPTIPSLTGEHRRARQEDSSVGFGSFDLEDNDNDGLLGLEALRDRAYSSPGPVINGLSSSPPVVRGYFPAHMSGQHGDHSQDRVRFVQRERPPLSQSYLEGLSSQQGERSYNSMSIQYASSSRNIDANNISLDSTELRGLGAIGRPDSEVVHRRSSASEAMMHAYQVQHAATAQEQLIQKFGALPTLNSHLQYQRPNTANPELQRPRHVRSVSQPVAAGSAYFPPGSDGRYYSGVAHLGNPNLGEGSHRSDGARRGSGGHPLSNSYDGYSFNQKGGNLPPAMGSVLPQGAHPMLQRRDALDFHVSPASTASGSIIAPSEDYRSFGMPSMISPGQSPQQVHYPSHSRQASDAASGMLSSSPMSVGSGLLRGQMRGPGEEDLTHPLVGENIEVPAELDQGGAYLVNPLTSQHVVRNSLHGHSHSLEQFPIQYMDASNPSTAGAAFNMPRVVYAVKFKRTQRNFVMGPRLNRDLKVGTYVIVEADRGEDLGIVIGKAQGDKYGFSARPSFTAGVTPVHGVASSGNGDLKRIIRLATHDEVSLLQMKRDEEDELLKICRGKVRQRGLPMNVVDAEYQFDRHKLTFFFEAEGRVDFRELVRDLFSMYKTRIWMQQLDKNTSAVSPVIPQMSNLSIDFGTPIIAPVSEFADSIVLNGYHGEDFRSH